MLCEVIKMETVQTEKKKKILSCIQPSGIPTLGNYLGALKNWKTLADEFDGAFAVADLHAITVRQDPAKLRQQTSEVLALLLAIGLDPEKSVIFVQSHVPAHAQLAWVLNCYTQFGEMNRMTQFKDKSASHADNVNVGLFSYPVLMAADILLYQADLVPVGADQKQHLELSRDIAERFNGVYGDVFVVPEPYIPKVGARVMSLQEPTRKMSKSDPEDTYIAILDKPEIIRKKLRRAVTDSENSVVFDPENKPGVANLMSIMSVLSGQTMDEISATYDGQGYGKFKDAVADCVISALEPIQAEYERISADKAYLQQVMDSGKDRASTLAHRTMLKVRKKLGIAPWKL